MKQICRIRGCERNVSIKKHGMCMAHVNQLYRTGEVKSGKIEPRKIHEPYQEKK